ncbi:MAG TPA: sulfite exporter TauE/SafE family protein [Solirubrobacteraceae bacterium]|jgi:hypothetical protein
MERARSRGRPLELAAVGTVGGLFSGLFGVGGGAVMVPLLMLWLGFDQRRAAGTSLMAIAVIAAVAAGLQGVYGNVDVVRGILIGLPALAGVVAGAWLQQRLDQDVLSLLFAALLVGVAIDLLVS